MLTISKPLSASQARTYRQREFASEKQNYWSRDPQVYSEWRGRLAAQWKLSGAVDAEHFARLSDERAKCKLLRINSPRPIHCRSKLEAVNVSPACVMCFHTSYGCASWLENS